MTSARLTGYVLLGVLGVLVGAAASLVQAGWVPWGLLLALAGSAGLFWGGALLTRTRVGAAVPAAGWGLTVLVLTTRRTAGDFVFTVDAGSLLFLVGGMVLAALCATLAPTERPLFEPLPPAPGRRR